MSRVPHILFVSTALVASWALPSASGDDTQASHVQAKGAAGVTEVGRPLDVLRPAAEAQARDRALAQLEKETGAEMDGASKDLHWQIRYWTNGAVSATATVASKAEGDR